MSDPQPAAEQAPAGALAQAGPEPSPYEPPTREEWEDDELAHLPPRPRRRLLTPLPLALLATLLVACGFIGGVLVQKGQGSSSGSGTGASGAAAGFASRLRALAGATGAADATGATGAGASGQQGFTRPTSGTVSYISGSTLYVTEPESNTVKVNTSAGTTVSKTVGSSVKDIRPGETVTVTGSGGSSGTIEAESIRVGGAGAGGGFASLFGAAATGSSSTGGSSGTGGTGAGGSSSGAGGGSGPALFGNG